MENPIRTILSKDYKDLWGFGRTEIGSFPVLSGSFRIWTAEGRITVPAVLRSVAKVSGDFFARAGGASGGSAATGASGAGPGEKIGGNLRYAESNRWHS